MAGRPAVQAPSTKRTSTEPCRHHSAAPTAAATAVATRHLANPDSATLDLMDATPSLARISTRSAADARSGRSPMGMVSFRSASDELVGRRLVPPRGRPRRARGPRPHPGRLWLVRVGRPRALPALQGAQGGHGAWAVLTSSRPRSTGTATPPAGAPPRPDGRSGLQPSHTVHASRKVSQNRNS